MGTEEYKTENSNDFSEHIALITPKITKIQPYKITEVTEIIQILPSDYSSDRYENYSVHSDQLSTHIQEPHMTQSPLKENRDQLSQSKLSRDEQKVKTGFHHVRAKDYFNGRMDSQKTQETLASPVKSSISSPMKFE